MLRRRLEFSGRRMVERLRDRGPRPYHTSRRSRLDGLRMRISRTSFIPGRGSQLALLIVCLSSACGSSGQKEQESYSATLVNPGLQDEPVSITIRIDGYTSDAALEEFSASLQKKEDTASSGRGDRPTEGQVDAGDPEKTAGIVVARTWTAASGRRIDLIVERPLALFVDPFLDQRSEDYPLGWIQIEVDASGKGSGLMILAARLQLDLQGRLEVEGLGHHELELIDVRRR